MAPSLPLPSPASLATPIDTAPAASAQSPRAAGETIDEIVDEFDLEPAEVRAVLAFEDAAA